MFSALKVSDYLLHESNLKTKVREFFTYFVRVISFVLLLKYAHEKTRLRFKYLNTQRMNSHKSNYSLQRTTKAHLSLL